jgi:hypothetical protein
VSEFLLLRLLLLFLLLFLLLLLGMARMEMRL